MKTHLILLPVAALLATAGCLEKETSHTIYLSPDGSAVWAVLEKDVYSDEAGEENRADEERAYLAGAAAGTHEVGRALSVLGPRTAVATQVIRRDRPFVVHTEASYASVTVMLQQLFNEWGIASAVSSVQDGDHTTLRIRIDFGVEQPQGDEVTGALAWTETGLKVVLTEGAFVAAAGFELSGPAAVLTRERLKAWEAAFEQKEVVEASLTWAR